MVSKASGMQAVEELKAFESDVNYVNANYSRLQEKYCNKYVAVSSGQIIASDSDYEKLLAELEKKKVDTANTFIRFIFEKNCLLIL